MSHGVDPVRAPAATELGIVSDLATTSVPTARPGQTAQSVRRQMEGGRYDHAGTVAVLAGDELVGLLPIERLIGADPEAELATLMDRDPPLVAPGADQEAAVWEAVHRHEPTIAVVDAAGHFLGLVPPDRLVGALLRDHDQDLARLGGYVAGASSARDAAQESVLLRLWHRIPWLLLGLAGAMLSAVVVGGFEEQLDKKVLLAFFLPAVVYMADAVGTQTETLLIRGLSVGVNLRRVVRRELATGAIVGALMAAAFLPFALAVWGDARVAVAVGLALVASCSIATVVAMIFPWLFQRLGADPAFGSGPLATVVQDLLSIAVYLGIATLIVG